MKISRTIHRVGRKVFVRGYRSMNSSSTFDLIEKIRREPAEKLILTLNFKVEETFFFSMRCVLLITEVKLSQGTIGRNLIGKFCKNMSKKCVLTATLWLWTCECNVYISNNVNS